MARRSGAPEMERLRANEGKEGPEGVAAAIEDALFNPGPKARYLVVSDQRDAEVAIQPAIRKACNSTKTSPSPIAGTRWSRCWTRR
jgi:hypothetical protein